MSSKILRPAVLIPCLVALFGWSGWAYYINLVGDPDQALRSGLTQGIYSCVMTFYMSLSVRFFYQRMEKLGGGVQFLFPTVATIGHCGLLLVLFHYLNHTPNILKTVVPPLSVATAYCLFLTYKFRAARFY